MTRVIQPEGTKGSLMWVQKLINTHPELINRKIREVIMLREDENFLWLSPLESDEFAEYQDASFIERLGISLSRRSRQSFWPNRGPQWDALGNTDSGKVFIIEAKAHLEEIASPGTQASGASRDKILSSLEETKAFLKVRPAIDWSSTFYQYANRLAHLYLLRTLNEVDAYLVFIYFLNDAEVNGPGNIDEWKAGIKVLKMSLGLHKKHQLSKYTIDVFIDIGQLT